MGKLWNAASDAAIKVVTATSSGDKEMCSSHRWHKTGKTKTRRDQTRHQYKCKNCGEYTWKGR